jgi:hypothetical protein
MQLSADGSSAGAEVAGLPAGTDYQVTIAASDRSSEADGGAQEINCAPTYLSAWRPTSPLAVNRRHWRAIILLPPDSYSSLALQATSRRDGVM